jgi:hypothetical protein
MSTGCPTCKAVLCCDDNPFSYSLVNGNVYENDQVSVNFDCPEGLSCQPGVYTIPKGAIQMQVTGGSPLRLRCCQSELVQNVPAGATEDEIGEIAQTMVNECARQLALCTANQTVRNVFNSERVCLNPCSDTGRVIGWTTPSAPTFPSQITVSSGIMCLQAGTFGSRQSQDDATSKANEFLTNFLTVQFVLGTLSCGWWNEEQICPDSDPPIVIPAFTVFSTVSQAAANEAAILAGCPSSCCISQDNVIGPLGFPNYLTYDPTNDLVFVACQTQGVKAIDPATDTVTGTRFTAGTTYWGGIVYVPLTDRVYCCVQIGATVSWQIINPLTMALVGTITPPAGHTFLTNLQPTYDPVGQRIIVAGRQTTPSRPAILQIDVNTGISTVLHVQTSAFNTIDFPGAYDSTRNRFIYKIFDFASGNSNLVIFSSAFAITGTSSLGAVGGAGTTGDVLYLEAVDKIFYSGFRDPTDGFFQLNADTLAVEFTISNTVGSIWFSENCRIVFQNNGTTVVQWAYETEEVECTPASPGFGLGVTTETATNKGYVVVQGAAGSVVSFAPP